MGDGWSSTDGGEGNLGIIFYEVVMISCLSCSNFLGEHRTVEIEILELKGDRPLA